MALYAAERRVRSERSLSCWKMASSTERGLGPLSMSQVTSSGTSRASLDSVLEPYCSPREMHQNHCASLSRAAALSAPSPHSDRVAARAETWGG